MKRANPLIAGGKKEMTLRLIVFLSLWLITALTSASTAGGFTVRAEGEWQKGKVETDAKRLATEKALHNAVEKAVRLILGEQEEEKIKRFLGEQVYGADPMKYVLNYRILSAGWITHFDVLDRTDDTELAQPFGVEKYHVWIEATIDENALREDLRELIPPEKRLITEVSVVILGSEDYSTFEKIKETIEALPLVREVSYDSFSKNMTVLRVDVFGSGHDLYERLRQKTANFIIIPAGLQKVIITPERGY